MGFSRSGNEVTVTGTETIQAFFGDAANGGGLTRQGHDENYQYYTNAYNFVLATGSQFTIADCSLSFGPGTDNNKIRAEGTAKLIIGAENTANGLTAATRYNTFLDLRNDVNNGGGVFDAVNGVIRMQDTSTIEIYSATVAFKRGNIRADSGDAVTWKFRNARIHTYDDELAAGSRMLISGDIDWDGFAFSSREGISPIVFNQDTTITQLKDFSFLHAQQLQVNKNTTDYFYEIEGYDPDGTVVDVAVHQDSDGVTTFRPKLRLISSVPGNDIDISTNGIVGGAFQVGEGVVESVVKWNYTILDEDGAGIVGADVGYAFDTDNGERSDPSTSGDYLADRSGGVTSGAGGAASELRPIINVYDREDGNTSPSVNTPLDIRTPLLQRIRFYGRVWIDQEINSDQDITASPRLQPNAAVSQTSAVAQAHTGISIIEGSFSLFGGTFSIKVVGNLTTNASLTIDDIYHYLRYWLSQGATSFNSRPARQWHDMLLSDFTTQRGPYGGLRTQKGVMVVDENDNLFPGALTAKDDSDADIVGTVVVVSGQTLAVDIVTDLEVQSGGTYTGDVSVGSGRFAEFATDTQAAAAGIVVASGGVLVVNDLTGGVITATVESGGRVRIDGAATTQAIDMRGVVFEAGSFLENNSGVTVTYRRTAGTQTPTEVETSGALVLDDSIPYSWSVLVDDTKYRIYDAEADDFSDWTATTAYTLTSSVTPTVANTFHYECVSAGTSSGTEPTWPTTAGERVTDGTVVWECVAGLTGRAYEIGVTSGGTGIDTTIPATALGHSIECNTSKDGGPGNAKKWLSVSRTAIASGIVIEDTQEDDSVYNNNNITGSTVTDFTWNDDEEYRWEVTPTQDSQEYRIAALYAYNVYWQTTDEGIRRGQQMTGNTSTEYGFLNDRKVFNTDTGTYDTPVLTGGVAKDAAGSTIVPIVPCQSGVTVGMGLVFADSGYNEATNNRIKVIETNTNRVDGLIEDDGGGNDRYTAKALEEAPTGGSSITQQEVRDAMKLAPTGGAPAADSIDDKLDDLETDVSTRASATDQTAIKAQTDKLTFNVSNHVLSDPQNFPATGNVDANMVEVGGTAVTGPDDLKADVSALALEATAQDIKATVDAERDYGEEIDYTASTYTKFAADDTTPDRVFDLEDADGNPVTDASTPIAKRIPQ